MKKHWLVVFGVGLLGHWVTATPVDLCSRGMPGTRLVELVTGDWSGDGHGITRSLLICSNLSKEGLREAYLHATHKVGFDFIRDAASQYEENWIKSADLARLKEHGIQVDSEDFDEEGNLGIDWEIYTLIYLQLVGKGNPSFRWSKVTPTDSVDIGGYGLFP